MYINGAWGSVRCHGRGASIYCALTISVVQLYVALCGPLFRLPSVTLIIHVSPLQSMLQQFNDGSAGFLD